MLKYLCEEKKVSLYRCAKDTQIPYSTLSDIALNHTEPGNINARTLNALAEYFDMPMGDIYTILMLKRRMPFVSFRSEMCHKLNRNGDINMLAFIRKGNYIPLLWKVKWYPESLYLLAMLDEITEKNRAKLCQDYDWYRKQKMKNLILPPDIALEMKLGNNSNRLNDLIKNANPSFLKYNILEGNIYCTNIPSES